MMKPTIHRNGTSRQSLLDQLCDAGLAISDAIRKLEDAAPHGRDYYPQGEGAIKQAGEEHRARIQKLQDVLNELQELAEHVSDA